MTDWLDPHDHRAPTTEALRVDCPACPALRGRPCVEDGQAVCHVARFDAIAEAYAAAGGEA